MGTIKVRIDVRGFRAWLGEQELSLTPLEFRLLHLLAQHEGRVMTRDQIMREVWGWTVTPTAQSTKTLDMHVAWLRKKLGDSAASPRYIATVRGLGFRLEAGVVELVGESAEADKVRVVLVKPGEVLVFGNLGPVSERVAATARTLRDQLGLASVLLFEADIDLRAISKTGLHQEEGRR